MMGNEEFIRYVLMYCVHCGVAYVLGRDDSVPCSACGYKGGYKEMKIRTYGVD